MRSRKELIYKNINDLTQEEIEALGDMDLSSCDDCGEIDLSTELNWIEGEDFYDNPAAIRLVEKGLCSVCDDCLQKEDEKD